MKMLMWISLLTATFVNASNHKSALLRIKLLQKEEVGKEHAQGELLELATDNKDAIPEVSLTIAHYYLQHLNNQLVALNQEVERLALSQHVPDCNTNSIIRDCKEHLNNLLLYIERRKKEHTAHHEKLKAIVVQSEEQLRQTLGRNHKDDETQSPSVSLATTKQAPATPTSITPHLFKNLCFCTIALLMIKILFTKY
jgi:hypothetical protein